MKYEDFRKQMADFPVLSSSLLPYLGGNTQALRNQLIRWQNRGLVHQLRKGLYILDETDRKKPVSRLFIANQMYAPSYVSTEYALGYYDLIPERVVDVTSVTARKTYRARNQLGVFVYQHISQKAFSGFMVVADEGGNPCLIAYPEKAVVDFIYLNLTRFPEDRTDVFGESFRFQNLAQLDREKLLRAAALFGSRKLTRVVENLLSFGEKQE